jgi:predicted aspartyl protease
MIRYQYVANFSPPAPFVQITLRSPTGGNVAGVIPGQIDSAADRTVIPGRFVDELQLASVRQILVEGLGGAVHSLDAYIVLIQIHDLQPIAVEIVAHAGESFVLLGRDVLNHLRIVLDGPKQVLEIE